MGNFTFNLDSLKSSAGSSATSFETSLNSKTKDADLTYTGTDTTVWDRVNGERLRRGLPSLTSLGYPRPPEDTTAAPSGSQRGGTEFATTPATTPDGSAKVFDVKGPPGLTREQAFDIFKKQAAAGGLVGFKSGDVLSAATQAADGLPGAQALVAQAQAGLGSALGSASSALAQAGGALGGSLVGTAAGLTSLVGPAVSSISGVGSALIGAAAKAGSVATSALQTINTALTKTPLGASSINVADFAKTIPAVSGIGPMTTAQVTGVLAQAKNLVAQSASTISNVKGIGEYGLNIQQLETAGYVKPGISNLLAQGTSSLAAIAKSPASWTGKDGIQGLSGLLASPSTQGLIQQDLMAKGVAGLGAVGIPVSNLSAQGLAGMALNAAKSLPNAEAFAKGLPIPGDALGKVKAAMNTAVREGAFAVNLVAAKIPDTFKDAKIPVPATDTVGRATVDAASSRIAGNDKIPPVNYGPPVSNPNATDSKLKQGFDKIADYGDGIKALLANLGQKISVLENQQSITQVEWDAVNAERLEIRADFNLVGSPTIIVPIYDLYDVAPSDVKEAFRGVLQTTRKFVEQIVEQAVSVNQRVKQLKTKIEGASA